VLIATSVLVLAVAVAVAAAAVAVAGTVARLVAVARALCCGPNNADPRLVTADLVGVPAAAALPKSDDESSTSDLEAIGLRFCLEWWLGYINVTSFGSWRRRRIDMVLFVGKSSVGKSSVGNELNEKECDRLQIVAQQWESTAVVR
jgi:hypothetical protein